MNIFLLKFGRFKKPVDLKYFNNVQTPFTKEYNVTLCSGGGGRVSGLTFIPNTHFSVSKTEIYHPDKSQHHKISNENISIRPHFN